MPSCPTVLEETKIVTTDSPKPEPSPDPMPAPQLPNLPASPDDPFQPDPMEQPPVTLPPDSDPPTRGSVPGRPGRAGEINPEVEPQFDDDESLEGRGL